ncbi:MAG: hypothetical protein PVI92_13835 [Chromatiales bacterium]|jgi:hypothetical protein
MVIDLSLRRRAESTNALSGSDWIPACLAMTLFEFNTLNLSLSEREDGTAQAVTVQKYGS